MTWLYVTLLIPVFGMCFMIIFGHHRIATTFNFILAVAGFLSSLGLGYTFLHDGPILSPASQLYIDAFNLPLIVLTTFITATTALFSKNYMWHNIMSGKITTSHLRLYHVMVQAFTLMMLLTLTTNNIGILWVAIEGSTLATVLLVSLYRTKEAVEAAWKYFILCIVGIALALFGTILVYASASQSATNISAILWTSLYQHASSLNPALLKLAFVFLLVGYGTKIGLVPMHNWLPDAHSESPAPMSALLSGLLLNVALYALVRFKILVDLTLGTPLAGHLMMGFGLLSFLFAAVLLHRQSNIKRLFSYSSIEHMGLITFAFGLGGPFATVAALFYMLMHSLTKSALFVAVGNVIQLTGTQTMEKIRGLIHGQPVLGWTLLMACIAISGFPPFGIFLSELMLVIATVKVSLWIAGAVALGIFVALTGLLRNVQPMVYGEVSEHVHGEFHFISITPAILHLVLVLLLGIYIPPALMTLLKQAANLIAINTL